LFGRQEMMMTAPFDPTRVPAGTLQGMAKRLSKHPSMASVPLSKCQEILAQTFGHASFHALKTHQPANRAVEGFRDVTTRVQFYALLEEALRMGVDAMKALIWIEELARRGGRWPLADLAQACSQSLVKGLTLAQSLEALGTEAHAPECFLIARLEEQGDWAGGLKEARSMAEQEAHGADMRRLASQSDPAAPVITRVHRVEVPEERVEKIKEALSQGRAGQSDRKGERA
jgi:hypothetical protein